MNTRSVITLLFLVQVVAAHAQRSLDSVYFFRQDQQFTEALILSPTFGMQSDRESYGMIQLNQRFGGGSFRKAQQAYSERMTNFVATGFNQLGRFHIGARFEFNNQFQDSLSNSLRSNMNELAPYYAYANKSGDYQRQNYILNAALGFALNEYVQPFLKLDYHRHWSAGTVDPRLSSQRFELRARPGVAVKLDNHAIGLYGLIGKADEQVNLVYKSLVFKQSSLYPDRIYHINYGYGSSVIRDSIARNKIDSYKGGGLEYASTWMGWNVQAAGEYQWYHNTNQVHDKSSLQYSGPLGIFDLHTLTGRIDVYSSLQKNRQHRLTLDGGYQTGSDGNKKTTGSLNIVNYKVNTLDLAGSYRMLWGKDRAVAKEIGVDLRHHAIRRQDLVQSVLLDVGNTEVALWGSLYVTRPSGHSIRLSAQPYLSMPTHTTLNYNPIAKSDFVKNVVFTDYYYHSMRYWGTQLKGEYMGRFFGKNDLGFFIALDYRKATSPTLRADLDPTFVPQGSRWEGQVGVRMYINEQRTTR